MTEGELALKFIDENNLAMKFLLWQELFLDPQIVNPDVKVEAEDITHYESTLTQDELNELLGPHNDENWDDTDDRVN